MKSILLLAFIVAAANNVIGLEGYFTTTKCASISYLNEGGELDDMTWEACKDLCLKDDMCKSFDWREKKGYNCAIQYVTRLTNPKSYKLKSSCKKSDWSNNQLIFTTTNCASISGLNEGGEFDDMTWEACKDLCLKDDMCKSFDWREKKGYNCAIQYVTRLT